ncbi:MAG: biotin-dependent carboxyltransferase family protein [Ruminococcaceae bacterium]|nr:biotin-dependent carboxyltransferase family protein [Oscillospiraceae bacterium]
MGFTVKNPGISTTVQDSGRYGYQASGVPVSGAMDMYSLNLANILVGNDRNEACLEMLMMGATLEFDSAAVIAITGADMKPTVNKKEVPMNEALYIRNGDVLSFSASDNGNYCYVAFAGGMDIAPVMGSRSTYMKAKIGGIDGRKLTTGDKIGLREYHFKLPNMKMRRFVRKNYESEVTLRVVMGPQDDHFTDEGISTFLSAEYTVTSEFDRMGCRLSGEAVATKNGSDIISDGICVGAVQVPKHGMPIVMLADRQTAGGYTKIATVISSDLDKLVQCPVGGKVRFKAISVAQSHEIYKAKKALLDELEAKLTKHYEPRRFIIEVNDKKLEVTLSE